MGLNSSMLRDDYQFFSKPSNIPSQINQSQIQLLIENAQNYALIKGTNGEMFRYYKRNITDRQREANIYQWRNLTNKSIVKVVHIQILQTSSLQKLVVGIFTDHIFRQIGSIKNLSIAQTIYLLKKTLSSFQEVFKTYGFAKVNPKCIGLNQKGQCKVWISQNLSCNQMETPIIKNQQSLIIQIIKIVQHSSNQQCQIFFKNLTKNIQQSAKYNFKSAEQFINYYCSKNQITVPLYLKYQDPISFTSKPKLMKMSNKSQETISFRKKSISSNFSQVNKTIQGEIRSPIKKLGLKDTAPRISIADRIPLIDQINKWNNQKSQSPKDSDSTLFSSKVGFVKQQHSQIKKEDIKKLTGQVKRSSLGTPKINQLSPSNYRLSSINSLLLQINERDQQASRESPTSSHDSIIEDQVNIVQSWSKKSSNKSFNKQEELCRSSIKKHINISHQFSISIINDRSGSRKSSQNRSRMKTQVNSHSQQYGLALRQKSFCTHCERFSSEQSERMISQILSHDNKPRDHYNSKEVQSVTFINNSTIPSRKQMIKKASKQSGKAKGNKYELNTDERQEDSQKMIKKIQEKVISSNNWKKILNKLLSSEKDMELKHSTSYEFQEDRIIDQPVILFEKLDRVGRPTKSIIPK